jgi:hypothetical protein
MEVCVECDDDTARLPGLVQDCGVGGTGEADIGDVLRVVSARDERCGCAARQP